MARRQRRRQRRTPVENPDPSDFSAWLFSAPLVSRATPATLLGPGVDFVGRFEQLGESIRQLGELLEVDLGELPHLNERGKVSIEISRDLGHWYDDKSDALVREVGAWEIHRYGYTFEA